MHFRTRVGAIALASALALAGCASGADDQTTPEDPTTEDAAAVEQATVEPGSGGPLNILLTNDDGWSAPGITAAYEALTEAGHNVTLVAPAENQSGQSSAMVIRGELEVTNPTDDPNVWSVSGTPTTAMHFGLEVAFDGAPDLVISGINAGSNAGADVLVSGTFGAAAVASGMFDFPAIAASLDASSQDQEDYVPTAQLLVDILDHGIDYLEPGYVLNVNYPELEEGQDAASSIVYADLAPGSGYAITYEQTDDTTWESNIAYNPDRATTGDYGHLSKGEATITLVATDGSIPADDASVIVALVDSLN